MMLEVVRPRQIQSSSKLYRLSFGRQTSKLDSQKHKLGVKAMIARSVLRCSATRRTLAACRLQPARAKQCRYSTASSASSTNGASPASMLAAFTNELDRIAPRFDIQGSQIQILQAPADFYNTLKVYTGPTKQYGEKLMTSSPKFETQRRGYFCLLCT
jgi:hypothetical protein